MSTAPQMDQIARRMNAMEAALHKMRIYRLNDIEDEWGDMADPTFDPIIQMIDAALSWEDAGYYHTKSGGRKLGFSAVSVQRLEKVAHPPRFERGASAFGGHRPLAVSRG